MTALISISICILFYVPVYFWSKKAMREREQRVRGRYQQAVRKILVLILIVSASCTTTRFIPTQQHRARLVDVKRLPHSEAALKLIKSNGDTVYMLNRNPYMAPAKYYLNDWYTVQYDSNKVSMIDGKKYWMAVLKHTL